MQTIILSSCLLSAVCLLGLDAADLPQGPLAFDELRAVEYWTGPIPHEIPVVKDRKGREGPKYRINMDVYRPTGVKGPLPAVVLVHGGGLGGGRPDSMKQYAEVLCTFGYVCFAPGYTLGKGLAPAVSDTRQAIRAIRLRADEFGIDPERLALWGFSAGGWIGSVIATVEDGESIRKREKNEQGKREWVEHPTDTGPLLGQVSSKPQVIVLSSGDQLGRYLDHIDASDPPILSYCGEKEYRAPKDDFVQAKQQASLIHEYFGITGGKHCPNLDLTLVRQGETVQVAQAVLDFLAGHGLATAANPAP